MKLERIGRWDEAERPIGMKQVEKRSTIVRPAELRGGGLQYPSSIEG